MFFNHKLLMLVEYKPLLFWFDRDMPKKKNKKYKRKTHIIKSETKHDTLEPFFPKQIVNIILKYEKEINENIEYIFNKKHKPEWTNNIGKSLIKNVTVQIGDEVISSCDNEWLDVWNQLTMQPQKQQKQYDNLRRMLIDIYEEQSLEVFKKEYNRYRHMINNNTKVKLLKYFQHEPEVITFID